MKTLLLSLVLAMGLSAQTKVDLGKQGQNFDFSTAAITKPVSVGASLPGTCSVGQLYFLSSASAGQNMYGCTSTNTFTLLSGSGGGSVSSVGLALPGIFSVTGTPVTSSGTLTATLVSQSANTFWAANNGASSTPAFRRIVAADIPTLNQSTTGNAATATQLATTPTICSSGFAPQGILATGNATGCQAVGGSGSGLPPTPATSGISYVPVATPTGTSTTTYVATAVITLPACSSLYSPPSGPPLSGPCITATGGTSYVNSVRAVTATSDTIQTTDVGGTVTYTNSSAIATALPQANLSSNFLPGSFFTVTNYGTGAVTVTASTSYIGPGGGISTRIVPGSSGSGPIVYHSCTFVSSTVNITAGVNNWDLENCN